MIGNNAHVKVLAQSLIKPSSNYQEWLLAKEILHLAPVDQEWSNISHAFANNVCEHYRTICNERDIDGFHESQRTFEHLADNECVARHLIDIQISHLVSFVKNDRISIQPALQAICQSQELVGVTIDTPHCLAILRFQRLILLKTTIPQDLLTILLVLNTILAGSSSAEVAKNSSSIVQFLLETAMPFSKELVEPLWLQLTMHQMDGASSTEMVLLFVLKWMRRPENFRFLIHRDDYWRCIFDGLSSSIPSTAKISLFTLIQTIENIEEPIQNTLFYFDPSTASRSRKAWTLLATLFQIFVIQSAENQASAAKQQLFLLVKERELIGMHWISCLYYQGLANHSEAIRRLLFNSLLEMERPSLVDLLSTTSGRIVDAVYEFAKLGKRFTITKEVKHPDCTHYEKIVTIFSCCTRNESSLRALKVVFESTGLDMSRSAVIEGLQRGNATLSNQHLRIILRVGATPYETQIRRYYFSLQLLHLLCNCEWETVSCELFESAFLAVLGYNEQLVDSSEARRVAERAEGNLKHYKAHLSNLLSKCEAMDAFDTNDVANILRVHGSPYLLDVLSKGIQRNSIAFLRTFGRIQMSSSSNIQGGLIYSKH